MAYDFMRQVLMHCQTMYISIDHVPNDIIVYTMPTLSKFLTGQRGGEQLLDSDGFLYNRRKPKVTALSSAWRCCKCNPPMKCPCNCYLALADNSLSLGGKPHNHSPDKIAPAPRTKGSPLFIETEGC